MATKCNEAIRQRGVSLGWISSVSIIDDRAKTIYEYYTLQIHPILTCPRNIYYNLTEKLQILSVIPQQKLTKSYADVVIAAILHNNSPGKEFADDGFTLVPGKKIRFGNNVKLMQVLAPPRNLGLLRSASEMLLRSLSLLNGRNCV
jgi:hypothetical protein